MVGDEPPLTTMTSTTTTMKANTTTGTQRARYQERRAGDTAVKLLGVGAAQGPSAAEVATSATVPFFYPTGALIHRSWIPFTRFSFRAVGWRLVG